MKKALVILAILLMAATTFTQTSRRPANTRENTANSLKRTTSNRDIDDRQKTNSTHATPTIRPSQSQARIGSQTNQNNRNNEYSQNTSQRPVQVNPNDRNKTDRVEIYTLTPGRTIQSITGNEKREFTPRVQPRHDGSVQKNVMPGNKSVYPSSRHYTSQHVSRYYHYQKPHPIEYRQLHYPYRKPVHISIYWTPEMRIEYHRIYPMVDHWNYPIGYQLETISFYFAHV
jgi:hypothetical protein